MLDPKLIKENSQAIKEMLKSRDVEFDLDGLIDADKKRRQRSLMGRAGNIAGGSLGGSTESAQGYSGTTLGG